MPTQLRMPDELYAEEIPQVIAPQYALQAFKDALNGRPFYDTGFRPLVLEFLVLNYQVPAHVTHMLDNAFYTLMEDLKIARVLLLERMPMMRAYHWQPGAGEEKGRWVVPTYIYAEHRHMLQLALDNAKSDVPSAGIHAPQENPRPKTPYRKASDFAPAALRPGANLADQMAKHASDEAPLSPEESIKLRKDLGRMNETLNPGEQFMVPDYSPEEQAYLNQKNQGFSNDVAMSYSVPSALLGVPTRGLGGNESQVAGAVNAGMAIEGAAGAPIVFRPSNASIGAGRAVATTPDGPSANDYAKALITRAKNTEPAVTDRLHGAAKSAGGSLEGLDFKLKSEQSLTRKIETDAGRQNIPVSEAAESINDVLRYTIILPEKGFGTHAVRTMDNLEASGYEKVAVKNTFKPGAVYKGINTTFKAPDGQPFELQFHSQQSFDVKQNSNHGMYEEMRLPSTSASRRKELMNEMRKNSNEIPQLDNVDLVKDFKL